MRFEPYRNQNTPDLSDPQAMATFRQALAAVKDQLGQDYPLVIDGKPLMKPDVLTSLSPSNTAVVVGRSAKAEGPEIEKAMDAAQAAYATWSRLGMETRSRHVMRLAAAMRRRMYELAAWHVYEVGKNFEEALGDVAEAIDFCEYYARSVQDYAGPLTTHSRPDEDNVSYYRPVGVGVVIPPWNFPLAILTGMTAGPVVVGNTVIIKPAPSTPVIGYKFMECVAEAGFPAGVINLLTGEDADLGDALVDHPKTRFINFTGSVATGVRIHERAAKLQPGQNFLKRVTLEMGGKDALIVDASADLDLALDVAVGGGFGFQGQKCSAPSRLIVVDDVYREFVDRFVAAAGELTLGAADENPDLAAVINEKQYRKILGYIERGKGEGKLALGGGTGPDHGYYIAPTIFVDVPPSTSIAQEEIFGPVAAVIRAKDFEEALDIANGTIYGLTGGVISRDAAHLRRARDAFDVGNLYLNRKITGALVGVQPFGGFKMSGNNVKAGGPDYLRNFVEMKSIAERL